VIVTDRLKEDDVEASGRPPAEHVEEVEQPIGNLHRLTAVSPVEQLVIEAIREQRVAVNEEVDRHTEVGKDINKLWPATLLDQVRA
jgi:hypothetical protein